MKKWILIIFVYLGVFLLLHQNYDDILEWIKQGDYDQIVWMFFVSLLLSIIPVIPFTIFAGLMGAKYGLFFGALINWFGSISGAIIIYLIAKYAAKSGIDDYLRRYPKLVSLHHVIKENAFVTILFTRLIPIVPPPVITIYAGISRIHLGIYIIATMIGKIPSMLLYAYIGDQVFISYKMIIWALVMYSLFLLLVFYFYRKWMVKRKLQHI